MYKDTQTIKLKDITLKNKTLSLAQPLNTNRIKWLVREYGADFIENIAIWAYKYANNPKHYFARLISKARWEETRETALRYLEKIAKATEIIKKIPKLYLGKAIKVVKQFKNSVSIADSCSDYPEPLKEFLKRTKNYQYKNRDIVYIHKEV